MTLATDTQGTLAIIVVMTLVTIITRFAGPFVMSYFTISPRLESFINAMAGSVLIAIITPLAYNGDWGARMALLTTAVIMLVARKPLLAIAGGIAAAAVLRGLV